MKKSCPIIIYLAPVLLLWVLFSSCAGGAETGVGQDSNETVKTGTVKTEAVTAPEPEKKSEGGVRAAERDTEEEIVFIDELPESADFSEGTPSGKAEGVKESSGSYSGEASASGLKAGFADDNRQYGYFLRFLEEYGDVPHIGIPVQERITVKVTDKKGKSIPNADIVIYGESTLSRGKTMADGSYLFFPSRFSDMDDNYTLTVSAMQEQKELRFSRRGKRDLTVAFPFDRSIPASVPLDILFILDTTGSMGEEIERLKTTIELIHLNLTNLSSRPTVRFGMVLYKDVGDEYVTKLVPLTDDLDTFRDALSLVEAAGGGDTPEDLQAALETAMLGVDWKSGDSKNDDSTSRGIRLAFIITDAPPHLDYGQQFTYREAAEHGKEEGIKIFSVGTGGLDIQGEYILRQISQYTSGRYIFLTYGETGESSGGAPGSVSHHTGSNFQTDKLEAIIIRFAKEELSYLTDEPITFEEPYFEAHKIPAEKREATLEKLFSMALGQLSDYAAYPVTKKTPLAILPIEPAEPSLALNGEYFTQQLILAAVQSGGFTLVERQNMQSIMEELKVQLSGITEEENVVKIGRLLNAEALVAGTLYPKQDNYELFLRLLRVETGEVLSVTRASIQGELGL